MLPSIGTSRLSKVQAWGSRGHAHALKNYSIRGGIDPSHMRRLAYEENLAAFSFQSLGFRKMEMWEIKAGRAGAYGIVIIVLGHGERPLCIDPLTISY